MKRTRVVAGALLITALTGCSSGHTATHKAPSSADNQLAYILTVRGILGVDDYTDAKLVSIAHRQCDMLTTGSSQGDVVNVMQANVAGRYTATQLDGWVSAAASAYCPDTAS